MIGSHDSFTYLKSTKLVMNLITRFWRCQNEDIDTQYRKGVRLFDIRICRDKVKKTKVWRLAHGDATLKDYYYSIEDICKQFDKYGDVLYRIWFEKGSQSEYNEFLGEIIPLIGTHLNLVQVVRKSPETVVYRSSKYPNMIFYCFDQWTASNVVKMAFGKSIADFAGANNPTLTAEQIADPNNCYFMDFCTNKL